MQNDAPDIIKRLQEENATLRASLFATAEACAEHVKTIVELTQEIGRLNAALSEARPTTLTNTIAALSARKDQS
jgi:septal ring factor EnvC (AmiA/AmiB activator)